MSLTLSNRMKQNACKYGQLLILMDERSLKIACYVGGSMGYS